MFVATMLFTFFTMALIVPKVERYSQNAAIEFYKDLEGKDVYVNTLGFKSYAKYFYFKKPNQGVKSGDLNYLLQRDIDKDAYFVCKNFKKDGYLKKYPELEVLYEKNGFVFLKRHRKND